MEREFGKWLMDIAKYIVTVIILTSALGGVVGTIHYIICAILVTIIMLGGLFLVKRGEKKDNENKNKQNIIS